jgi:DNA polymerase elongation subunit (family B)
VKILLLDIETAPLTVHTWNNQPEYIQYNAVIKEWYILCWGAKWLGAKEIISSALIDFKDYEKNKSNDKNIMTKLRELLIKADIVIGHNLTEFDRKKINTRMLKNGLGAMPKYRIIDTLTVARNNFSFTSNKLSDLCKFLGLGEKIDTGGFDLWLECMEGDPKAWAKMVKYCRYDISLQDRVYNKLRPWISSHPHINERFIDRPACPKCGSDDVVLRGVKKLNSGEYRQFQCRGCGGWSREKENLVERDVLRLQHINA